MAHEVETMFYVGEEPWHGLGHRFERSPGTVEEAISGAGLGWRVGMMPLETSARTPEQLAEVLARHPEQGTAVEAFATYRSDTGAILGVVGPDYTPLQNAAALGWFQPFLESGAAQFEAAGSLREGRRVWALARVMSETGRPEVAEVSPGDAVALFILLSHGHDGTLAVRAGFTPIRVICANTERMARQHKDSKLIRLKHTRNVEATLKAVRETMDVGRAEFRATIEQYRALRRAGCNPADLAKYVVSVFEPGAGVSDAKKREKLEQRKVEQIEPLFLHGRGAELAGSSWFGAYNAVTEYLQHERGSDDARRLDSAWFGNGAELSGRAYELALRGAGIEVAA
jgi:phage/plasmid-like protein (TIGR03299 family)